jgi:uncharacterized protein
MEQFSGGSSVASDAGAGPVLGTERISALDTLRGVAVLGILLMNILGFAYPFVASFDPRAGGGVTGANLWIWGANTALFEGKMRAIFSMLFGAGMLVLTARLEQRGLAAQAADVYYRRLLWLLAFGLIHAYFIWWGDILFFYAVLGLFLFPLRRLSARTLMTAGMILLLIGAGRGLLSALEVRSVKIAAQSADAAAASGVGLTEARLAEIKDAQKAWADRLKDSQPRTEDLNREIEAYRGGYASGLRQRAGFVANGQPQWLYHFFIFDIGGMMLLGIGLLKLDVFTARLPYRSYWLLALFGYGVGVPLASLAVSHDVRTGFDPAAVAMGAVWHAIARLPVALGHVAIVMLVVKAGVGRWITAPLAAVGQTAFSCYILTSIICTTLFYGYGFAWFGRLERYQLYMVVAAVWVVLLVAAPLWLMRFRFGPLEWLWRSLTYRRRQPMRVQAPPAAAPTLT